MRNLATLAILFTGLAGGVLGYGWWHAARHATFHLALRDTAEPRKFEFLKGAELTFHDAAGRVLARGKTDEKYGVAWVAHPTAGYCGPDLAQPAYAQCFRVQSGWLLEWIREVRHLGIATARCRIERVPLEFSENRDSAWTWWIPLPHVGGTPYTHFDAFVQVNSDTCAVIPPRG